MIGRIIQNTIRYSFPVGYFTGFTYSYLTSDNNNLIEKMLTSHVYGSMGFAYPISGPIFLYYYKENIEDLIYKL